MAIAKAGLGDNRLSGVKGFYTPRISSLIAQVESGDAPKPQSSIELTCYRHPSDKYYIGVKQVLLIHAAIEKVKAVLDDINNYDHLFPGYKDVRVVSRNGADLLTYWEQTAPLPIIPNIKYEILYHISELKNSARLYRYQLYKPTRITASDGFILIRSVDAATTSYVEYDFFNANWGAAKILGAKKIWRDSVEGLALSDLATKLRAENDSWSDERSRRESRKWLKREQVENCVNHRIAL